MLSDIIVALISAAVAIIGTLVGYISLREKQARENQALTEKLHQEHKLLQERLEREQTLIFDRYQKEQLETFRMDYYQKQLEAYQELWALLAPLSYYSTDEDTIIVKRNGDKYLNGEVTDKFFLGFRSYFYSKNGIFLSKEMRNAIFTVRDSIMDIQNSTELSSGNLIKISNNKAKRIENGLDWIRKNIRRDAWLEDVRLPTEELSNG